MQDTNTTNTVSSTPSSLQKEQPASVLPPVIKVRSVVPENASTQPDRSIAQRVLAFLSGIFSGRHGKKSKAVHRIELVVVQEQKPAATAVEEQVQKLVSAVTSVPAKTQGSATPENTLRKIAERQFMTMDVSQATKN